MLSAQDIIGELQSNRDTLNYGACAGAGALPAMVDQLRVTKSIFVLPPTETVEKSTTGTQVVRQRSTVRIQLLLGFIIRTATGIDQSGDVDALREAIKTVLVGWTPNDSIYLPLQLVSFEYSTAKGAVVFYELNFFTTYYVRAPGP